MSDLYLSIGGNLGNRAENLSACRKSIREQIGDIMKASSIYESESWGFSHPRDFYNQVLHVKTNLNVGVVLQKIQRIETELGRIRSEKKAQTYEGRAIDIDILLLDKLVVQDKSLQIPHPHMLNRNFVMIPMVEIAETIIHPILQKSMKELLADCPDKGKINQVSTEETQTDE
ncbi:MAG: 2-amino-4-hydroxy-6-hydroxymethyldihydropteridine diphosphokinase [Bacteroidales bacterium]|jgi:2-amino-4-hydroxy-6-hydroxymethyldihydropteridine diphosphokinase|nr:2-amino-4-hydroxy-6-hydroxymethyldihydropteridine diphosphokinase [Bacteroidales bacterium]